MGQGPFGVAWGAMVVGCFFVPALLLVVPVVFPRQFSLSRLVVACILINVGMWLKRYLIIVPTLMTPYIPAEAAGVAPQYHPTWVEWTITAGGFAVFMLLFTLFAKLFPIVSIWETVEGVEEVGADRIGIEIGAKAQRVRPAIGKASPGFAAGMAILLAALLPGANRVSAVEAQAQNPQPQIAITTGTEDGRKVIVATVTREGKPVENARVALQVQRTFGNLTLGEDDTLDDGTVAVPFPADLPGDSQGKIQVFAQIKSPPEHAAISTQATLDGALKTRAEADPFPRALWSPRAPLGLILTIFTLLTIVWSTYAFVVIQLIKIKKCANASIVC